MHGLWITCTCTWIGVLWRNYLSTNDEQRTKKHQVTQHIVSYQTLVDTVDRYAECGLGDIPAKKPTNATNAVVFVGQKVM